MRRCVGCYTPHDKSSLVRVVKAPDGKVFLDEKGHADGRGAYICKKAECLEKALKTRAVSRALKCEIPADVLTLLERQVAADD